MTLNGQSAPDSKNPHLSLFNTEAFYGLRDMEWCPFPLYAAGGPVVGWLVMTPAVGGRRMISGHYAPYGGVDWLSDRVTPEAVDDGWQGFQFVRAATVEIKCGPTHWGSAQAVSLVALHRLGFRAKASELSYWIPLPASVDQYVGGLKHAARNALGHTAGKFTTRVLDPTDESGWLYGYSCLKANREAKGRRISVSEEYVRAIRDAFPGLVRMLVTEDADGVAAAALIYRVRRGHDYVQFWGDHPLNEGRSPMNVLARDCVAHSIETGAVALDLGVSSNDGVPDSGLCRFKRSVGAVPEVRWTLCK